MTEWAAAHCHPEAQPKDLVIEQKMTRTLAAQILHFVQDDKLSPVAPLRPIRRAAA